MTNYTRMIEMLCTNFHDWVLFKFGPSFSMGHGVLHFLSVLLDNNLRPWSFGCHKYSISRLIFPSHLYYVCFWGYQKYISWRWSWNLGIIWIFVLSSNQMSLEHIMMMFWWYWFFFLELIMVHWNLIMLNYDSNVSNNKPFTSKGWLYK